MSARRVVITGIGPVAPIGTGVAAYWDSLRQGRSGVRPITAFDTDDMKVRIAADVQDFDPAAYMDPKDAKRMARFSQLAVAGARLALDDSGLDLGTVDPERASAVVYTGGGGVLEIAEETLRLEARGPGRVGAFFVPIMAPNMAACQVSMQLNLQGPALAGVAACAASIYAFIDAYDLIQRGEADVAITGGAESNISRLGIAGLANMHALSRRNDDPERASRPFDKDRDGFVFGEGAVLTVLETLESAEARGARIYAEVLGGGRSADAHHITAPAPDGRGAARAMRRAVERSGVPVNTVDYICAHGTSTPLNDLAESVAIKSVFGDQASRLAVSSPKSMTGHLMGAAGAVSVAATALAIHHQTLPPTINLDTPDPECDLDYVPNEARSARTRAALVNGFGFGGQNGVVVLGALDR